MKGSTKYLLKLFAVAVVLTLLFSSGLFTTGDDAGVSGSAGQSEASVNSTDFDKTPSESPASSNIEDDFSTADEPDDASIDAEAAALDEHGTYDSKDDVALFIHTYGHLPDNYITKQQAEDAGWSGGSVEKYCPGKCIGGSRFGNFEGLLPDKDGRTWTECDINTLGASSRGAERIVFSNDGLIYYTPDHYESFTLLYGDP